MNKIFVEAQSEATSEVHFLQAIIDSLPGKYEYEFVCMGGVGNLSQETIVNQLQQCVSEEDNAVILVDADTPVKGAGFEQRKKYINDFMKIHQLQVQYFIYPDNNSDGDVETLMDSASRKDLHSTLFDCMTDYESCVQGIKDSIGNYRYVAPDMKTRLYTYMHAQKLNNKIKHKLGKGDWLFNDSNYWNLDADRLAPLRKFLVNNLKL